MAREPNKGGNGEAAGTPAAGETTMRDYAAEYQQRRETGAVREAAAPDAGPAGAAEPLNERETDQLGAEVAADQAQATADAEAEYLTSGADDGVRLGQILAMATCLPCTRADTTDWITRNVLVHGRGTHLIVGRVFGYVTDSEDRVHEHQGKQLESVLLLGDFGIQSTVGAADAEGGELYMPKGYGTLMRNALRTERAEALAQCARRFGVPVDQLNDEQRAGALASVRLKIDVDLGLEATGRSIQFAWTVVSRFRSRRPESEFEQLRQARRPAPGYVTLPGPGGQRRIVASV